MGSKEKGVLLYDDAGSVVMRDKENRKERGEKDIIQEKRERTRMTERLER